MPSSGPVLIDAIDFLLTAARAELALRDQSEELRSTCTGIRRQSLAEASERIADVFNVSNAYEESGSTNPPTEPQEEIDSLKQRDGTGYAEACEWAGECLALLQKCATDDKLTHISTPLLRSVLRPLCIQVAGLSNKPRREIAAEIAVFYQEHTEGSSSDVSVESRLIDLTKALVAARTNRIEIMEALAALIRLSSDAPSSNLQLRESIVSLKAAAPRVHIVCNGPYIAEGSADVTDYLGVPIETLGCAALCRCGASQAKPFCDGSHAVSGFIEAKDPRRVADKRDEY